MNGLVAHFTSFWSAMKKLNLKQIKFQYGIPAVSNVNNDSKHVNKYCVQ